MEERSFLRVQDVAAILCVSVPTAYKIMKRLNVELAGMGYITVAGRVSRKYFETKIYG